MTSPNHSTLLKPTNTVSELESLNEFLDNLVGMLPSNKTEVKATEIKEAPWHGTVYKNLIAAKELLFHALRMLTRMTDGYLLSTNPAVFNLIRAFENELTFIYARKETPDILAACKDPKIAGVPWQTAIQANPKVQADHPTIVAATQILAKVAQLANYLEKNPGPNAIQEELFKFRFDRQGSRPKLHDLKADPNSLLVEPRELKMARELQFPITTKIELYSLGAVPELENRVYTKVTAELEKLTAEEKSLSKEMKAFLNKANKVNKDYGNRHEAITTWFDFLLDIEMNPAVAKNPSVQKISALLQEGKILWSKFYHGFLLNEDDQKLMALLGAGRFKRDQERATPPVCRP